MAGVFNLSLAASIGLHAMALLSAEERLSARQISDLTGASQAHLSKVLQRLAKAGLLTSGRGPAGGFELARPASEITLLDIYEAIDGPLKEGGCSLGTGICPFRQCLMGGIPEKLTAELRDHMSRKTLQCITLGEEG